MNNDSLMWRYWAAKQMANGIIFNPKGEFIVYNDDDFPELPTYIHGMTDMHTTYLTQLLKKEWFRK